MKIKARNVKFYLHIIFNPKREQTLEAITAFLNVIDWEDNWYAFAASLALPSKNFHDLLQDHLPMHLVRGSFTRNRVHVVELILPWTW